MWYGAPIIVAHGIAVLVLDWRAIVRAFGDLRGGARRLTDADVPAELGRSRRRSRRRAVVLIGWLGFGIAPHLGVLAVAMTFVLALIACRVTGESDVAPIGALGKVTQLAYGVIAPARISLNLLTASITAGASLAAAKTS